MPPAPPSLPRRRLALLGAWLIVAGCRNMPDPALTQLFEARRVVAELHVELVKATDASDRAVLADTDEESLSFAREARGALQAVQTNLGELGALVQRLGYREEAGLVDELGKRFAEYRKVDEEVLSLAVENTNLKAQRLSFGPVREAADAFGAALASAAKTVKDHCRADGEVARATLAVREVQILQSPHIAEADAAAMGRLEAEMSARLATARDALAALARMGAKAGALDDAKAALEKFEKLSAELVALSRRNTNVRSLSLSLRQTPKLTAACDASLTALEQALEKRGFTGTR